MTAIVPPPPDLVSPPPLPICLFSVDQYHRMIETGILGSEDPVELLDGLIVVKGHSTLAPAIRVEPPTGSWLPVDQPLAVRRFSIKEYRRLRDLGILRPDEPVELVEGWIVRTMTRNPPHDVSLALALKALHGVMPPGWHCRCQSAVTTDTSEPEPDVAAVRGQERDYSQHHPRPRDCGMTVEVSDTKVDFDRQVKGSLYARVAIPVYWIINLQAGRVEVYTDPTGPDPQPGYRQRQDYGPGDSVPVVLDGRQVGSIAVNDLLP